MKNTLKLFGNLNAVKVPLIIALAVIIGFSFTACDDGEDGGGGIASGLSTLNLSGRVVLEDIDVEAQKVTYTNFTGPNLKIDDSGLGGSGTVNNGNLSYSVGKPEDLYPFDVEDLEYFFGGYELTASKQSVEANILMGLYLENADGVIYKGSSSISGNQNSSKITEESVYYIYVDDDVTITGKGYTETDTETEGGITYTETFTSRNFSLPLKKGWNAIHEKWEISGTISGPAGNPTGVTLTVTETISLGNPALRWIIYGYTPPVTIPPATHIPLTFDTWANGNFTNSVREQYFSFTATSEEQFIHFNEGEIDDVYVEVYHSNGSRVGERENLWYHDPSYYWDVTVGQTYYIRVWPYYSGETGNYQIAFNSSWENPDGGYYSVFPSFNAKNSDAAMGKAARTGINRQLLNRLQIKK